VTAHALTHAHPDHQGASRDVCEKLGIPFWCPEADIPAAEDPDLIDELQPDTFMAHLFWRIFHGPGHKVDRPIRSGEEIAGFQVIDAPGHSAGHVVFWRESDRVLILGDVLSDMDQYTGIPGLKLPKDALTPTRRATASPRRSSPTSSRISSASGTARRCGTRGSSSTS
jgi:glyoxylase-like metal-dependent hydrolase (beta-lactamase superfamily II)